MYYRTTPYTEVQEEEGTARPQICIPQEEDEREKTYVAILGEDDSHDCATSSKRTIYGPCVVITDIRLDGTNQMCYAIDEDTPWEYINRVISKLKGKVNAQGETHNNG